MAAYGELKTPAVFGVEAIALTATQSVSQSEGNTISHTAQFTKVGGGIAKVLRGIGIVSTTLSTRV